MILRLCLAPRHLTQNTPASQEDRFSVPKHGSVLEKDSCAISFSALYHWEAGTPPGFLHPKGGREEERRERGVESQIKLLAKCASSSEGATPQ